MTNLEAKDAILPRDAPEEDSMSVQLRCEECEYGSDANRKGRSISVSCDGNAELIGIVRCLADGRQMPITIKNGTPVKLDSMLPVEESRKLEAVPEGIVEDVKEAERAHFARLYKASAVMCRRALQLALEDKTGSHDKTLGPLLQEAKTQKVLSERITTLAERVLEYGNVGAHKTVELDPKGVEVIIFDTVTILNEICKANWAKPSK